MGPRGWQSKIVKPTSTAELQHLVVPTRSKSQHAQDEQSSVRDWSREDDLSRAEEETPPPHQQNDQACEVPLQRGAKKLRQATKGFGLHKTTQSMGTRMPISLSSETEGHMIHCKLPSLPQS